MQSQGMMGAFGVVPEEPIDEFIVEGLEVGEEQLLVVVNKLLLEGAVKTFAAGIHLRCFGEGVPLGDVCCLHRGLEVSGEFRAVIVERVFHGKWQHG